MSDFQRLVEIHNRDLRTIRRWCAAGKIPGAYRTKSGHWRLCGPERMRVRWRYANRALLKRFERGLQNRKRVNAVLDASMILRGVFPEDFWNREALRRRDPELAELVYRRPIRDFVHPQAVKMVDHPYGLLMIEAKKFILGGRWPTPATLAASLRISVATLYRRYGPLTIRRACNLDRYDWLYATTPVPRAKAKTNLNSTRRRSGPRSSVASG